MNTAPIAAISDIHGNPWALERVLADISRRGITRIVNLGDCLYGPLEPAAVADTLMALGAPTVRGNEDRILVEPPPGGATSPTLERALTELAPEHLAWLAELPLTAIAFDDLFLCHGSPLLDHEYLMQQVTPAGVRLRDPADIAADLAGIKTAVVLCGHDHLPRTLWLPGGTLVVNPGSVGLPAYSDDLPHPHAMETGAPHARYTILNWPQHGLTIQDVALPYDWEAAAACAQRHGRSDWAAWLRTGRATRAKP